MASNYIDEPIGCNIQKAIENHWWQMISEEQAESLLDVVKEMRNKQKEYFNGRDSKVLQECKQLERMVDQFIKNIEDRRQLMEK